jgi:hypothetical protein
MDSLTKLLIDIGVRAETKVPLLFQKSRWAVVAILAIIKASGAIIRACGITRRTRDFYPTNPTKIAIF